MVRTVVDARNGRVVGGTVAAIVRRSGKDPCSPARNTSPAFVLSADLRLLTAIQAWRAGGPGFLALYAHGLLPGLFAVPAGWATSRSASPHRGWCAR